MLPPYREGARSNFSWQYILSASHPLIPNIACTEASKSCYKYNFPLPCSYSTLPQDWRDTHTTVPILSSASHIVTFPTLPTKLWQGCCQGYQSPILVAKYNENFFCLHLPWPLCQDRSLLTIVEAVTPLSNCNNICLSACFLPSRCQLCVSSEDSFSSCCGFGEGQ